MKPITRRHFTKKTALSLGSIPFLNIPNHLYASQNNSNDLSINIFSKHLQFLNCEQASEKAAELGFNGLDLTVRPKGHVEPKSVIQDLQKAIEAIKKGGSTCTMITTAVENSNDKIDINVLKTASELGIKYYRANWFKYSGEKSMEEDLVYYQQKIKDLSTLNSQLGIVGCYQNHAGLSIGSSIWEIKKLLKFANPNAFGAQYDIRHAVLEGGLSWENGLKLIKDSIKTIVLKDFKWVKENGAWKPINVPIGEGMVDFKSYFKLLKKYKINVPTSLHLEYPLGGAEKGKRDISIDENIVFNAIKRDLDTVKRIWAES